MSQSVARKIERLYMLEPTNATFLTAGGQKAKPWGLLRGIDVTVGRLTLKMELPVVSATNYDILLGSDWLVESCCQMFWGARKLRVMLSPNEYDEVTFDVDGALRSASRAKPVADDSYLLRRVKHPRKNSHPRRFDPKRHITTAGSQNKGKVSKAQLARPPFMMQHVCLMESSSYMGNHSQLVSDKDTDSEDGCREEEEVLNCSPEAGLEQASQTEEKPSWAAPHGLTPCTLAQASADRQGLPDGAIAKPVIGSVTTPPILQQGFAPNTSSAQGQEPHFPPGSRKVPLEPIIMAKTTWQAQV